MIGTIQWSVRLEDYHNEPSMYYDYCIEARLGPLVMQRKISNYLVQRYLGEGYIFEIAILVQRDLLREVGREICEYAT